jgi:hypothetical protein
MKNFLLSSVLLIAATIGLSQSVAPGGVSSNLMLWLKADSGTSTTTDGNAVQDWSDSGPHANDAYQSNIAARPLYKANQFNGHPAIKNASGQYFDIDMSAVNEEDFTVFTVVKRESGDDDQYVLGIQATLDDDGFNFGYLSSSELAFDQYGNVVVMDCPDYAGAAEIPSVLIAEFSSALGKRQYLIRDGVSEDKKNTNNSAFYLSGDGNIGRGNGNNYFKGLIAEVIIYNGTLSDQDKKRVLTYLCVKYGLSIPVSQNVYYSNGAFPHDLFGIGKSTTHGLNQTSSRSINADDILQIFNASSLDDGDFLLAGNNDSTVTFGTYGGSNCAFTKSLRRVWNLSKTGDAGTVSLRFDLTGVTGFDPSQLMLLVDINGDGFDDETGITGTYNAPYFEVANVSLPTHSRVTIGTGVKDWYAVVSGNSSGAIWATTPTGTPQVITEFCQRANLHVKTSISVNNDWSVLSCNNLNVATGAIFNAGNNNVNILGNLAIGGLFNGQTATISMKGASAQTITGSGIFNVHNLMVDNATGVAVDPTSGGTRVKNYVYVNAGNFNTGNKLTLLSDATSTGMIAPLLTGTITGDVTVQRYANRTAAGWYMIGSPIQNMTVQDWNDDLVTTGFIGSDFPPPGYTFNNLKYYDETLPGGLNDGFVGVNNVTDALLPRMGYFVYMNAGVMNLDVNGTIYSGTQNMPVSYTSTGNVNNDGWNFLANPYPSTIDWNSPNWTKHNINNAIYVWNPATNQYASFVNNVGTHGGSRYIPSSQSFFVVANGTAPQLTLEENCKSLTQGSYKSGDMQDEIFTLSIQKGDLYDETTLVLNPEGSLNFESNLDAYKLRSPMTEVPYLATITETGHELSINAFSTTPEGMIIPLRVEVGESGVYTFLHQGLDIFAKGACVELEDLLMGVSYPLNQYQEIEIPLNAGDNELRFQLRIRATHLDHLTNSGCAGLDDGSAVIAVDDNGPYNFIWMNQVGEVIHAANDVTADYELNGLAHGIYTLKIENNGNCGTTETIFYIGVDKEINAATSVTPSTCPSTADGEVTLEVEGGDGDYHVQWSNGATENHLQNVPAGQYTAFISDDHGCNLSVQVELPANNDITSSFETTYDTFELKNGAVTVQFYNTSEGAENYNWDFGDITIGSSEQNPSHIFNQVGVYEVVMTASNGDCESYSTKTLKIARANNDRPEFASEIIGTLTDEGAQIMFFFNEPRKLKITAYTVLGQQLIEPIIGVYERQTIRFSERRYAANALIEVLDMTTGERTVLRLGN